MGTINNRAKEKNVVVVETSDHKFTCISAAGETTGIDDYN
jgi:hypothetical protein